MKRFLLLVAVVAYGCLPDDHEAEVRRLMPAAEAQVASELRGGYDPEDYYTQAVAWADREMREDGRLSPETDAWFRATVHAYWQSRQGK